MTIGGFLLAACGSSACVQSCSVSVAPLGRWTMRRMDDLSQLLAVPVCCSRHERRCSPCCLPACLPSRSLPNSPRAPALAPRFLRLLSIRSRAVVCLAPQPAGARALHQWATGWLAGWLAGKQASSKEEAKPCACASARPGRRVGYSAQSTKYDVRVLVVMGGPFVLCTSCSPEA